MSAAAAQRLQRELMDLMSSLDNMGGITAFPSEDDLFSWRACIPGPPGSYYETITFDLSLAFPKDYPYAPPTVRYLTPCYHPNVSARDGYVCLDILKEQWSAVLTVGSILLSLQTLLAHPNLDSPLNAVAAQHWADAVHMTREAHSHASRAPNVIVAPATASASASTHDAPS